MTRWSDHLTEDGVTIYLFHGVEDGVATEVRNYTRKHLPRDVFISLLRDLSAHGTPVSMDDIVANREQGTPLPPRAFAITFDDGFENNLSVAAPVLVDLGIPATFYVTSDFIDNNRMSWIDRIEFVVEQVSRGHLNLPWGECRFESVPDRMALLEDIRQQVKSNARLNAEEVASSVQRQLMSRETWSSDHPLDRKMNWAEVSRLASGEGLTVGGHSHSHTILTFLDNAALEREITLSLDLLRDKGGIMTHHYSYPEGLAHCFDERVIAALRRHGIRCCPTAIEGGNPPEVDLFHLRRVMVM